MNLTCLSHSLVALNDHMYILFKLFLTDNPRCYLQLSIFPKNAKALCRQGGFFMRQALQRAISGHIWAVLTLILVDCSFWKKYLWNERGTFNNAITALHRQAVCCKKQSQAIEKNTSFIVQGKEIHLRDWNCSDFHWKSRNILIQSWDNSLFGTR